MKECKASDYETAFNYLIEWLAESSGVVEKNMPDPDEEVDYARADGYLTCCNAAIVLAGNLKRTVMRAQKE